MAETVQINVRLLTGAITKLISLADSVDTHRRAAIAATPVALPPLSDARLGTTAQRLRAYLPDLQTRLDLAKLLDTEGDGNASYSVPADTLDNTKKLLAAKLVQELGSYDPDDDPHKRGELLAGLLTTYGKDKVLAGTVMRGLGPDGVNTLIEKLAKRENRSADLQALQDSMAKGLAIALAAASTSLDEDWGRKFGGGQGSGVILRYGNKLNLTFGGSFLTGVGLKLRESLLRNPTSWGTGVGQGTLFRFGEEEFKLNWNPFKDLLNVADNSTESAQTLLSNKELRDLLLVKSKERGGVNTVMEHVADDAGKVLEKATIDAAHSKNAEQSRIAAEISSHLLSDIAKNGTFAEIEDELGGIIATYIMDVDRDSHVDPGLTGPGAYSYLEKGWPRGITARDGMPQFGISLDSDQLRNLLGQIGDNDLATERIGKATSLYNQRLLDIAAERRSTTKSDDPIILQAGRSAFLSGFLQDALLNGKILREQTDLAEAQKFAQRFTLPIDYVSMGKTPPIVGSLIKTTVKSQITDLLTDPVETTPEVANQRWNQHILGTRLQAYYAMAKSGNYSHAGTTEEWPIKDWFAATRELKTPNELSNAEKAAILRKVQGTDQDAANPVAVSQHVEDKMLNAFNDLRSALGSQKAPR